MAYEEDKQSALTRALIMAGAAMTQPGPGGFMASLGRGGMMGLNAYDNTFEEMNRRRLQEEALRRSALEDKLKEIALTKQQVVADIMSGNYAPARPAGMAGPAMGDAPDWKANPMNAGSSAAAPSVQAQARESMDPAAELRAKAVALVRAGALPEASSLQEYLNKAQEKFSTDPKYDQSGRAFVAGERGGIKFLDGIKARDKIISEDLGGKKMFRTDYSTQPLGEIAKTVSPDAIFTANNPAPQFIPGSGGGLWVTPPARGGGGGQAPTGGPGTRPGAGSGVAAVQFPDGFVSKDQSERADALRKEFRAEPAVKNYETLMPVFRSAVSAGDTRAGDVNIVYAVAKAFDPTSVVREGEYGTVVQANNIPNWLAGHVNALAGGGRLSAGARKELLAEVKTRLDAANKLYGEVKSTYQTTADQYKVPHNLIFTDYDTRGNAGAGKVGKGKARGSGPRTVNFNDLPDA